MKNPNRYNHLHIGDKGFTISGMKGNRHSRVPALIRLGLLVAALLAICYGATYYWGMGAGALSGGALLWWELTRNESNAGHRNERNSEPTQ